MEKAIMNRNSMFTVALFLATLQIIDPVSEQERIQEDISVYLPQSEELKEWEPVGSARKFVGEDLYDLINGGAVIYYEYGFKQVITQEYAIKNGSSVNLEIYEMKNAASAYGIYSFKTGDEGEKMDVGSDALLEDYYMNFWKGNFLVTLTAYDSDKETLNGLLTIAATVAARIKKEGQRPLLVDVLPKENLESLNVKYIRGNLALSNNYEFDANGIFGVKEGVIGDYGNYRIFLFKYDNEGECLKWFESARDDLKDSSRFDGFTDYGDDFSMTDRVGNHVYGRRDLNYILIFMGAKEIDPKIILEELKGSLR